MLDWIEGNMLCGIVGMIYLVVCLFFLSPLPPLSPLFSLLSSSSFDSCKLLSFLCFCLSVPVCLSVCLSVRPSLRPSVPLSISLSLSLSLSLYVCACLSVSICLPFLLSSLFSVFLSLFFSSLLSLYFSLFLCPSVFFCLLCLYLLLISSQSPSLLHPSPLFLSLPLFVPPSSPLLSSLCSKEGECKGVKLHIACGVCRENSSHTRHLEQQCNPVLFYPFLPKGVCVKLRGIQVCL